MASTNKKKCKGATKRCSFGVCKSDSRFKKPHENYTFMRFPQPCKYFRKGITTSHDHIQQCAQCSNSLKWVQFCQRADGRFHLLQHVNKDKYICSLHLQDIEIEDEMSDCGQPEILANTCCGSTTIKTEPKRVEMSDQQTQTTFTLGSINRLNSLIETYKIKLAEVAMQKRLIKQKQRKEPLTQFIKSLQTSQNKCVFYTGMPFVQIDELFELLSTDKEKLHHLIGSRNKKCIRRMFTYKEELILTLTRLVGGLLVEDMHYRFRIPKSRLSRVFTSWIQFMHFEFKEMQTRESSEKIEEHLPAILKRIKNVKAVVDCDKDLKHTEEVIKIDAGILFKQLLQDHVYVEEMVTKLKMFRILNHTIPYNMRSIISQLVYVCVCLIDFQPIVQ